MRRILIAAFSSDEMKESKEERVNHAPLVGNFAYMLRGITDIVCSNKQMINTSNIINILYYNIKSYLDIPYNFKCHTTSREYKNLLNEYQPRFLLLLYVYILAKENRIECSWMNTQLKKLCVCVLIIRQNEMNIRQNTDEGHLQYYEDIVNFEQNMTLENAKSLNKDSKNIINEYYHMTLRKYK